MENDDPLRCATIADTPYQCQTCTAMWSEGYWTWGCQECGGGSMQMACELCLGQCDAVMYRDPVASNESRRARFAHSLGPCTAAGEPTEKAARAVSFELAVRALVAPRLPLRVELIDWSTDGAWQLRPLGPAALPALSDAIERQGLRASARALAHALFVQQEALPELPRLKLEGFFQNPGALVVLEPLTPPTSESATRPCRIHRVLNPGHWLMRGREAELPFTDPLQLPAQRRHLAVVQPNFQRPGMFIAEALDTGTHELELIDLHRLLIARGEESVTRRP